MKSTEVLSKVKTRAYYPDHTTVLTRLINLKNEVKSGRLSDAFVVRNELISTFTAAARLGAYADYYNNIHYTVGDTSFGAARGKYPIGGGEGYSLVQNADMTAKTDDELYLALDTLKEGQILLVTDESVMDLSDFLLGGDMKGYVDKRIDFTWTVKDDVAWCGQRGVDGSGGAILKVTSFTNCAIILGKNARLSGLVIQGPDRSDDTKNHDYNLSVGIVVKGNGAVIENCEICGFFRAGVRVVDAENVTIQNNYFHDILSPLSGHAVSVENAKVNLLSNLFANVNSVLTMSGENSHVNFTDNVDAGNVVSSLFSLYSGRYSASHNTFLSKVTFLSADSQTASLQIENNLFLAKPSVYGDATALFASNLFDLASPRVYEGGKMIGDQLAGVTASGSANKELQPAQKITLPALALCYYTETDDSGYILLQKLIQADVFGGDDFIDSLNNVIASIGGYANYLHFSDTDMVSIVADGQRYGGYSDGDMIGGGYDYSQIFTTGDYIVTNEEELLRAIEVAKAGEVIFLPGDTYINVSDCQKGIIRTFTLPAGVTLASDRGRVKEDGSISTGAVLANSVCARPSIIKIGGEGARITGLVLKGPDPARHIAHHRRAFRELKNPSYYWQLPNNLGVQCGYSHVEFDNLEVCAFNTIGIAISDKENPPKHCKVHHTYIHHCQLLGLGYGVKLDWGYCDITYNMFNYNRHSISGTGNPLSGFVAENNIEMGESIGHYFDMHGGADRKDGTIISGEYMIIHNNTFLGPWRPYVLRGLPTDRQDFSYNIIYEMPAVLGSALSFYAGEEVKNATVGKNIWGVKNGNTAVMDGIEE